jgi:hypothetical protein
MNFVFAGRSEGNPAVESGPAINTAEAMRSRLVTSMTGKPACNEWAFPMSMSRVSYA